MSFLKVKPVLIKSYISEKATDLRGLNKYIFEVERKANKTEVKKVIEKLYNVKVEKINFGILKLKKKRMGQNITQFKPKKKAIVTLKEGNKIEI
ncbi:MAG: 50S ribosomal protein L23 [Minisyncoccia bacterium]